MSARLHIDGGRRLAGRAVAPPDKSIAHRALILAALGRGSTTVVCGALGEDNQATQRALEALGVRIAACDGGVVVEGVEGPRGLRAPAGPIDCANSGTTMRLLAGVLAASPLTVTLTGDDSLRTRPMDRLAPLIAMGAQLDGQGERARPPLTVRGGPLRGLTHRLAVASAQVKSAVLLAGLWAEGETVVIEPERSRDHTERMLRALGVDVTVTESGAIVLRPLVAPWSPGRLVVPPDLSSAAFLLGAALLTDSPDVVVETAVNPTRAGVLEVLRALGATVTEAPLPPMGGEPVAAVSVARGGGLTGGGVAGASLTIAGALTVRAIDELPLLAALAAFLPGRTTVKDAGELRVKESDRLRATAALVRAFGGHIEETADGLIIDGDPARLRPATVDAGPDHRIAMTACVLALAARGHSTISGMDAAQVSFPGFAATLAALGAHVVEA